MEATIHKRGGEMNNHTSTKGDPTQRAKTSGTDGSKGRKKGVRRTKAEKAMSQRSSEILHHWFLKGGGSWNCCVE
jgi:hypothetical protein